MGKKVRHEEHENHERWLVSYADFITLLFAFFTVLYATAQSDQAKLEAVVDGMNAAFDGGMPAALLDVLKPDPNPPDAPTMPNVPLSQDAALPLIYSIKRGLEGSLSDNTVQIGLFDQNLVLVLPERLLFAPGSAELHPSAYAMLTGVAGAVDGTAATVEVIGHADSLPISAMSRWTDNWELASARSLTTLRYLARKGVRPERLSASATVTGNSHAESRAVTIRVRLDEPGPAAELVEKLPLE